MSRLLARARRLLVGAAHPLRLAGAAGQTTAEYALVILGAAAVATLLLTWAAKSHAITKLFDTVIGRVLAG